MVGIGDLERIKAAEADVDRCPSLGQKESGNYAKGHVKIFGLDVTIENPKGAMRSGVGKNGKRWSVKMPATYGYIKGTEGKDGDHVDVYIGQSFDAPHVWVIDQIDAETKRFDEHKCFLGFSSRQNVLDTYRAAFSDGKADDRIGDVTRLTLQSFKDWLASGETKKPMYQHLPSVKSN